MEFEDFKGFLEKYVPIIVKKDGITDPNKIKDELLTIITSYNDYSESNYTDGLLVNKDNKPLIAWTEVCDMYYCSFTDLINGGGELGVYFRQILRNIIRKHNLNVKL